MIAKEFISDRLNCRGIVTFTHDRVHFVCDDDIIISIPRPYNFHFNEDGLNRAIELLDDPRFENWYCSDLKYSSPTFYWLNDNK